MPTESHVVSGRAEMVLLDSVKRKKNKQKIIREAGIILAASEYEELVPGIETKYTFTVFTNILSYFPKFSSW